MPFFLPPDPSMGDAGSDYIPIDPRRRGRMPLAPPMSPSIDMSAAPPPPTPAMIPYVPQPPNPTSQGLISALQGDTSWQNAPTPRPYVSPRDMMRQYGITDLTPPQAPQVNPAHGFWGKLGQHLLGAAEGMGSQRGLLPMIIGGVAGGVKPQLGANAWYNNVTMPRFQQAAGAQQQLGNQRLEQISRVGALTGVDPTTGEPTYAAQQASDKADAQEQYRQLQDNWKQQHDKLERDVAEGRISQQQAALDSHQIIANMQNQMKELELTFRDRMATTAEEKAQIARELADLRATQQGQPTIEQTTFNEQPNAAYQQIQQKWYRQQQLNPDGSKPDWMSQSDYDLSFKEATRQAEKEAKAGGVKATTRNETKQITKGGGTAPTTNKRPFPAAHLATYMSQMGFKTREEALAQLAKDGFVLDEGK